MNNKKRDNKGRLLFMGETQEKSGRYRYSYVDALGKRKDMMHFHFCLLLDLEYLNFVV